MFMVGGVVNAQVWVEDYNYTDTELSSSKWTAATIYGGQATATFTGSYMRLESPMQNYDWGAGGGIPSSIQKWTWFNSMPLDHDWTVVQRFKPNYSPTSFFTNILGTGGSYIRFDYLDTNAANGAVEQPWLSGPNGAYKEISANWDYQWMGISYVSSLRKMSTIYSTDSGLSVPLSENFVVVGETDLSNTTEQQVPIIHQTMFYSVSGSMDFSKISIIPSSVPEPSAFSLLAVGLGALAMMRRRRS